MRQLHSNDEAVCPQQNVFSSHLLHFHRYKHVYGWRTKVQSSNRPRNALFDMHFTTLFLPFSLYRLECSDLYYDDPELFECQRKSDETLATLCSILQCSRLDIGVVAASRGLLLGDISLHSGVNNGSSNSNETHADHITPEEFSCASYGNTIMGSEASTQLSSASSFGSPFESSIGWHASTLSSSSPPSHDCISPSSSSSSAHLHPPACALLIPRAVPCVSSYNLEAWASSSEPLFRINSIRFVLVVEKETVFQRLAGGMATTETCFAQFSSSPSSSLAFSQSRSSFASSSPPVSSGVSSSTFPSRSFATKHNCLIVTSKGYPNVNTRTFLRMVQVQYPHLPFFCLSTYICTLFFIEKPFDSLSVHCTVQYCTILYYIRCCSSFLCSLLFSPSPSMQLMRTLMVSISSYSTALGLGRRRAIARSASTTSPTLVCDLATLLSPPPPTLSRNLLQQVVPMPLQ